MNSSGLTFHSCLLKRLLKPCQKLRIQVCTVRNLHLQKPVVFDGRGERGKCLANENAGFFGHLPVKSCCSGAWRKDVNYAGFHTTSGKFHGEYEWQDPKSEEEVVKVHIVDKEGKLSHVRGKIGDNLLYLSKRFDVGMEGACEASLACTTCHVYVDHDFLDLLPEATETEEDLLDQAPFLKENSRLGCQIILNKSLDGIKLTLPSATKNFYVDGHKPTPH